MSQGGLWEVLLPKSCVRENGSRPPAESLGNARAALNCGPSPKKKIKEGGGKGSGGEGSKERKTSGEKSTPL